MRTNSHGFILIELVIVMIVMGILFVLGIGAYQLLYVKTDLRKVTEEVAANVNYARLESIAARDQNKYGVRFYSNRYELFIDPYSAGNVIESHKLPKNVTFNPISLNPSGTTLLIFEKLTGSTSNYGSVRLNFHNDRQIITINQQGALNINENP